MTTKTPINILKEYTIGILKVKFEYKKEQGNLLENLQKYMIPQEGTLKKLSSTLDKELYGKK